MFGFSSRKKLQLWVANFSVQPIGWNEKNETSNE